MKIVSANMLFCLLTLGLSGCSWISSVNRLKVFFSWGTRHYATMFRYKKTSPYHIWCLICLMRVASFALIQYASLHYYIMTLPVVESLKSTFRMNLWHFFLQNRTPKIEEDAGLSWHMFICLSGVPHQFDP